MKKYLNLIVLCMFMLFFVTTVFTIPAIAAYHGGPASVDNAAFQGENSLRHYSNIAIEPNFVAPGALCIGVSKSKESPAYVLSYSAPADGMYERNCFGAPNGDANISDIETLCNEPASRRHRPSYSEAVVTNRDTLNSRWPTQRQSLRYTSMNLYM